MLVNWGDWRITSERRRKMGKKENSRDQDEDTLGKRRVTQQNVNTEWMVKEIQK